jgi:nucleotide-binding universal stress UspA family protein
MDTIVVGYDGTDAARRALTRAADLAQAFGGRLVVTSVAPALMPAGRGIGPYDPADPPELHEEQLRDARALLQERGVENAELDTTIGGAAAHILDLAERRHADLIVVGTREPGLLSRLLGLSVSESVQRRAHCDVLIVH